MDVVTSKLGVLVAALAILPIACGSPSPEECRVETVSSALVGGTSHTGYLGLSGAQESAVVAITFEAGAATGPANLCSGVALGRSALVTAAHCFDTPAANLLVTGAGWRRALAFADVVIHRHEALDVAIVEAAALDAPLALPFARVGEAANVGDTAEVAGAGVRDDGTAGEIEFGVASVTAVADDSLTVELLGPGGPCGGDSGGPLLRRGAAGGVEVLGILSEGAPTCQGPDRYVRLDKLQAWLESTVGAPSTTASVCSTLGAEGRCFGTLAVWCEGGRDAAESCAGGKACGWDSGQNGFRCVAPASDPCRGVTDLGRCFGETARRCVGGVLQQVSCSDCGGTCTLSSRTGKASCS